jgi:hypothetical protein
MVEMKGNGKGYLRGTVVDLMETTEKMVGGGCPGSITINYQNNEKLRQITKNCQNHQHY